VIQSGEAIHRTLGPEKTDGLCEEQLGFRTAKAVIASEAVTVHASGLFDFLAGVGGWSITKVTAFIIFPPD
jgi:hypothetical protein